MSKCINARCKFWCQLTGIATCIHCCSFHLLVSGVASVADKCSVLAFEASHVSTCQDTKQLLISEQEVTAEQERALCHAILSFKQ